MERNAKVRSPSLGTGPCDPRFALRHVARRGGTGEAGDGRVLSRLSIEAYGKIIPGASGRVTNNNYIHPPSVIASTPMDNVRCHLATRPLRPRLTRHSGLQGPDKRGIVASAAPSTVVVGTPSVVAKRKTQSRPCAVISSLLTPSKSV